MVNEYVEPVEAVELSSDCKNESEITGVI